MSDWYTLIDFLDASDEGILLVGTSLALVTAHMDTVNLNSCKSRRDAHLDRVPLAVCHEPVANDLLQTVSPVQEQLHPSLDEDYGEHVCYRLLRLMLACQSGRSPNCCSVRLTVCGSKWQC